MTGFKRRSVLALLAAALTTTLSASPSFAEKTEVRISRAPALTFLPLMVMQAEGLIEKRAVEAGLEPIKVEWVTLAGPTAQVDALMSGSVDIIGTGATALINLWSKTSGTAQEVKGVTALGSTPLYLNTRNPAIKSITDFSEKDRIAVPAVKLSFQAMLLQMAAAKAFGPENYAKIDHLTVSLSGAEAVAALSSPNHEINSSFNAGAPATYVELDNPAVHRVLTMSDILGEKGSTTVISTSRRFHDDNPKLFAAILSATDDAMKLIKADPQRAIDAYFSVTGDKKTEPAVVERFMSDPETSFSMKPTSFDTYSEFMLTTGVIKQKPSDPSELFFPGVAAFE